jgi:sulfatase maturation enzyme AslB (radical SAM superfamily)
MQFCTYGFVRTCCPSWTKIGPIGNLYVDKDIKSIWNGARVQKIRKAVLEGRLEKVCNVGFCPVAVANNEIDLDTFRTDDINMQRVIEQIRLGKTELTTGPVDINLSDSGDCNLKCRMCRANDAFYARDQHITDLLFKQILPVILPTASRMTLTGNGDPFFRKETRELMQSTVLKDKYPALKLQIITNGMLLNEKMWQTVQHNAFAWLNVSVDGASKKTYEYVRRGGKWEIIRSNLDFISKVRQLGYLPLFSLNYLVLKSNYHEILDFARLALELRIDTVVFQKVSGLLDCRENIYFTRDMEALKAIGLLLMDPIFNDQRINISEIQFCKKFANHKVTDLDKLCTRFIIVLFSFPVYSYYAIRYRFAPVYFMLYKIFRRIGIIK